ncbi:tetratricopeptide repeat protein [Streptomyces sp. NPDC002120]|uniref:tetratricopeptide repeat protein n=1 Tax=Streptomyces sp. NPDC002120 TaxID=3364631 RepID=UPI0036BE0448
MPDPARELNVQLRALEGRAQRARKAAGLSCSRREAAAATVRTKYRVAVRFQAISDWLAAPPKHATVPSAASSEQVLALVQVWCQWAGEGPNERFWRDLLEQAQVQAPARGTVIPAAAPVAGPTTQSPASGPLTSWPHQVGVIPRRASAFQERAEAKWLQEAEAGTGTTAQVLAGMGGVGKTQLAAAHARYAWENGEVDLLVWVTAASREAVIDAYAQAAADILRADPANPERAATAFLAWLEPKPTPQAPRWLIVLDDVADPGDLRGLWPPARTGRTLVTTRRRDAARIAHGRPVPVELFTPIQATTYLQQALASHERRDNTTDLAALAEDLGHLPLALSQAAVYLADTHLDAAGYRVRLADRARQLADLLPESDSLPDDQPTTVAAAWSLSLERADQLRPTGLARPMLQLASMLDPNGIPHAVLTSEPALTHLATHRTARHCGSLARQPPVVTAEETTGVLHALHRLSLIDHSPNEPHRAVRIHHLIQRAVRDPLTPDQYDQLARAAADALLNAWPEVERDTDLARVLRANTTALTKFTEGSLHRPDAHTVLTRVGKSLGEAGQLNAAVQHFRHLTDTTAHHLGPDHPSTLAARHNLASWRGRAGDPAGATAAYTTLLEDRIRVLGPDHPHTLDTRHNLADWQGQAGDLTGAAAAYATLLLDRVRVLGPDHPDTLTTRHNLAYYQGRAGDPAGATAALATLLEDRIRVLGPDHPDTLTTRHNLVDWQGQAGNPAGATAALATLLQDRIRVLGPDHPDTLTTRHNLAYYQGRAGDPAGATAAYATLLQDRIRVLGPDHPDTLTTRHNLADLGARRGDRSTETSVRRTEIN